MKNLMTFATIAVALIAGLTGCRKENGAGKWNPDPDVAYLSIKVDLHTPSRGSSEENDTPEESSLKSFYLITLDDQNNIVGIPGGSSYYILIDAGALQDASNPQAVKVSAAATNLVVIANPGPALIARINTLTSGSSLATLNAAIASIDIRELVGDASRGFAMILAGDETGKSATPPDNIIATPCVSIAGKIIPVTTSDTDAKTLAEQPGNRVPVRLERLTAKLRVAVVENPAVNLTVLPMGAKFAFESWTVDALNTTYFPFAEKTILATAHTPGSYIHNFYTRDPNFDDILPYHTDVVHAVVDGSSGSYRAQLPWNDYYGWKNAATDAYLTENTAAANAQKYGNITRLIIRGVYTPQNCTENADWFRWAGVNYASLGDLQAAYSALPANPGLRNACEDFYVRIAAYYSVHDELGELAATNFASLQPDQLDKVEEGGQVVKNGANPVIRWYQKGRNYYDYEIRHDDQADGTMAFAKYGVVRNNFYRLTLNSVGGPGTPWYPELSDEEIDPQEPIDEATGYLGLSVSVGEWILWESNFGI